MYLASVDSKHDNEMSETRVYTFILRARASDNSSVTVE